jgi:hypothetical protein
MLPTVLDHAGAQQLGDVPISPATSCVVKVADFSSRGYWDNRFASEYAFEWLQPSSTILPTVKAEVQVRKKR